MSAPPQLDPRAIRPNPGNPRRYFNDQQLDLLRTSVQEVGILVPLIVYGDPDTPDQYVLMDGERRWRCSLDLGLELVPVSTIDPPSPLDNLLRMFNIHSVREDWPLISVALSLREVMARSGEERESRLADMTGLTRSTVRRAKRLLNLPDPELELIQQEAHLDRTQQVHREDLYLEIEQAMSVVRNEIPTVAKKFTREHMIRQFAAKAEAKKLPAITDFRYVAKLVKAADEDLVSTRTVTNAVIRLIKDVSAEPKAVFDEVAALAYEQQNVARKAQLLRESLIQFASGNGPSDHLRKTLSDLRDAIEELLEREP